MADNFDLETKEGRFMFAVLAAASRSKLCDHCMGDSQRS